MREVLDDQGRSWQATWVEATVAHLVKGAVLAFRPTDAPDAPPVPAKVEFNSPAAAEFALRTMGEKELRRRLEWAKTDAGIA